MDIEALDIVVAAPDAVSRVRGEIRDRLVAFNATQALPPSRVEFAFTSRAPAGELIGGISGGTKWQWMFVEFLWVDESARGRGLGRRLLRAAEALAVAHGCTRAHLETVDFQARPFYEREGYEVFATLEDYPPGHRRYFMYKRLNGPAAPSVLDSIDRSGG